MRKPENYSKIKDMTTRFKEVAKHGTLKIADDQPIGFILSDHDTMKTDGTSKKSELTAITGLAKPKGHVVILFGIEDGTGKLTVSFLGCDEEGTINDGHITGKDDGQETWEMTTANRNPPVVVKSDVTTLTKYLPDLVLPATEEPGDQTMGSSADHPEVADPTPYNKVKDITNHFIRYARESFRTTDAAKPVPLGIAFSKDDLDRICKLGTDGKGVIMLFGLEKEGEPESLTVSFVGADAGLNELSDTTSNFRISNKHKLEGADGEETWANNKTVTTIAVADAVVDSFLSIPNP